LVAKKLSTCTNNSVSSLASDVAALASPSARLEDRFLFVSSIVCIKSVLICSSANTTMLDNAKKIAKKVIFLYICQSHDLRLALRSQLAANLSAFVFSAVDIDV